MKQISFRWGYKIFLAIFFACMQVVLWAQEGDKTVTTKTTESTTTQWYSSPWVWVAGGAVFIIINLIILFYFPNTWSMPLWLLLFMDCTAY